MSRTTPRSVLLLGICAVLATGCGSSGAGPASTTAAASVSPGTRPPDGSTLELPADAATPGPAALTRMVCGSTVRTDVAAILGQKTVPLISKTWIDRLYTCIFELPVGKLVLSVKESPDTATARAHYTATRKQLPTAKDTPGLGEIAYLSPDGVVGLVKDNFTLTVDATGLPAEFGTEGQKRTDFAYEVATVVLGCWTDHG